MGFRNERFFNIFFALTLLHLEIAKSDPAVNISFVNFFEGLAKEDDPWDILALQLKPECSNLPDIKTSPPGWQPWRKTVSDVGPPPGKCVRLFKELDCCGAFYDVSETSHSQLVLSDWNDKVVSFREVDCNSPSPSHPSDCNPTEKDSFLAIFYENWRYKSDRISLGLEVSSFCRPIPLIIHGDVIIEFPIFDIFVPEGKCMLLFAESNCEGNPFSYEYNGWFFHEAHGRRKIKSFHETSCDLGLSTYSLPCPTGEAADSKDGYRSFGASFFEGYRSSSYYHKQLSVGVTADCADVPTDIAGPRNLPWNEEISDVTLPKDECICLFDEPGCDGASFHVISGDNENNVVYNFNDRTKSYRSCYDVTSEGRSANLNIMKDISNERGTSAATLIKNLFG